MYLFNRILPTDDVINIKTSLPPHALGIQFLKLVNVGLKSLQEETATAQVQIKLAWTWKSQLVKSL